jgi:hypothetical protein
MRKYVAVVLFCLAIISGVFTLLFSSPKYQIGDKILVGRYCDTAYEAFIDSDGCPECEFKEDIATVNVNNDFAVWISSTKDKELMLVKMKMKEGKYCSLDDFTIIKIKDCNSSKFEREFTLGEEKLLLYTICPSSDFKNEDVRTEKFIYNNKSFIFAYKIVHNSY